MPLTKSWRRGIVNLALAGASALVFLAALEGMVRLIYGDELLKPLAPPRTPQATMFRKKAVPGLRYDYKPGSEKRICFLDNPRGYFDPDNCLRYKINAQGFRGPEVSVPKPAGVYRILGLGDSFAFGWGVREQDTYLRRLERLLNAEGKTGYEVLNFGVEGYATTDEAILLKERGLEYQPDLVLVSFFLNDPGIELNYWESKRFWPRLRRYSRLWELLARRLQFTLMTRSLVEQYHRRYLPSSAGWQKAQTSLLWMNSLCQDSHARLVVVILPWLYNLDDSYPFGDIHTIIREFCEKNGIPALDLLPAFRGRRQEELWVYPTDQHPNELGHRIIAEAVYRYLLTTFPEKPAGG